MRVGAKQNFGGGDFSQRRHLPPLAHAATTCRPWPARRRWKASACYKLELKAKDRSVAYDRVVYWVRSDGTFFPVRAEYYTISGRS